MNVRTRFTTRVTRARLVLEGRRARRPLVVVVVAAAVGLACWGWILAQVGGQTFKTTQTVRFAVDDATGVVASRDDVRMRGIPVGKITAVELTATGAVITAKIDTTYGTVYRDARAQLRPATALQDIYIDVVDPGNERAGRAVDDAPLPPSQTDTSVNVADVLQAFNPLVRRRLAAVLQELGGGLEDRGRSLRTAFVAVVPLLDIAARTTRQLAVRESSTRRLVHNVGVLTGELARRETELRRFVDQGARSLSAVEASAPDLDATLAGLPPTLAEVNRSFRAVQRVISDVDRAIVDLGPVAAELPQGLKDVRMLSAEAKPAVTALQDPVRRLVPLVQRLRPLSEGLKNAVLALRPQVGAIDHITRASLPCIESDAVQKFFQWTPSVFKFQDANGPIGRGDATVGLDSAAGVKDPAVGSFDSCTTAPKEGQP